MLAQDKRADAESRIANARDNLTEIERRIAPFVKKRVVSTPTTNRKWAASDDKVTRVGTVNCKATRKTP